jgi:photosystem II stability/assembly factor-like uncharacterized protein
LTTDRPGSVDQLRFADPVDGYAAGNGLWQTHDGGAHWAWQRTVAGISHAVVTDVVASGATVYALVSGTDPRYGGTDSHVRLASAAASSGQFRVITDLGVQQDAHGLVASHDAVYFLDGPVGGAGPDRLVRIAGSMLTRTRLPTAGCDQVAASTATAVLLVCGSSVASGSMGHRAVYGSADSGRTYRQLPGPGRGGGYDNGGVADAGDGHAVVATGSGELGELRTTADGARTWTTSLRLQHATFTELGFENSVHGVVIVGGENTADADGRLYRTSDGGRSWSRVTFG